jgi:hypothetical protein
LRERHVARIREDVRVGDDDVTRIAAARVLAEDAVLAAKVVPARKAPLADAAREAGAHDDTLARLRSPRARPDGVDLADHVAAETVRIFELEVRHPAPDPYVEMVERHRADANAHLARARLGQVDGLPDEDLGAAMSAEDDGFGLHVELCDELAVRTGRAVDREDGVRQAEREKDDGPVDRMDVVDVDLAGFGGLASVLRLERGVDVLVHERKDVRLLDRHDVVEVERLVTVRGAELLLELDGLFGRLESVAGDLSQARRAEGPLEGEPHRDGEKVAEGERRLVEGLRENLGDGVGDLRLRHLEAGKGAVQLVAGSGGVVGQPELDLFERGGVDDGIPRHGPDRRASYPHEREG